MFTGGVPQDSTTRHLSFSDLGLSDAIVASLKKVGFDHPTPIQVRVIPQALEGLDIVGLAQTGSGKTAAFGLPLAERLRHGKDVRALILCPTREIALQTEAFLDTVGRDHQLRTACLIGGVKYGPQIDALRRGADIVVGSPGRLWDHFERRNLRLDRVEAVVLDEADHMLDLGFLPQVRRILEQLPQGRQTMMFSATMPATIDNLSRQFMRSPVLVDLRPDSRTAAGIEHRLYLVERDDMRACLLAIAAQEEGSMLIFLRRKIDVDWACRQLEVEGHPVEKIHSSRTQRQRVEALRGLREGEHRILIATDIAARGIDIPIIEHIVNFGPPETVEDYVHRAGRTARGSLGGTVSTIATWTDKEAIHSIESAIGQVLPRCTAPGVDPYIERESPGTEKTKLRRRQKIRRRLL